MTTIIGRYDIAIVGGGPAGLSAAYKASKLGANVILFEKDESIAHSIRTSGVSWIEDIEKLGISKDHYNPIKNYCLISPSNEATIRGDSAKSCVLNVRTTYQFLALLAAEAGTEIMVRSNVANVITDSKNRVLGLKVSTPKGDLVINCKLVIDASGFSSSIARRLSMVNEWKRYGVGAEYECYCEHVDPTTWTLMVGRQYSDVGYAWVFPVSKNRVRIGVGIAALKVQARWIGLSDDEWDKEIDTLRDLSIDEFLDFIKAEFTTVKMMKLALSHPKLAARQLFNIVLKK
jgi:digeranylgeranylglycerophospholipid reductase